MNSTPHHHSRLLCRVVRFVSSCSGLPPSRHLARCDDCRAHFVAEAKLEGSLRRAARGTTATVPPGLESRILDSIPYSTPEAHRPIAVRRGPLFLSLVGAAAALAVAVVLLRPSNEAPVIVENGVESIARPVIGMVDTLEAWRQRLVNLNSASPLELEIDAVYSDTRSALRFLAMNFLTSEPAILVPPEQRRT